MAESEEKNTSISLPYEWAIKKTLGPTLDEIGVDLEELYRASKVGVAKIALAAKRKITRADSSYRTNLRVTRDAFWNGAFTDEDVCAEYFGGILASSRSENGKDDAGIFYLYLVKSLSSSQLRLHYFIYSSLNILLSSNKTYENINVAKLGDIRDKAVYFLSSELIKSGIKLDIDLVALSEKNLIDIYNYSPDMHPDKHHVTQIYPTTLGIQLFAVAANRLHDFREFNKQKFDNFDLREQIPQFALTAQELFPS